jgi:hypothetical protein
MSIAGSFLCTREVRNLSETAVRMSTAVQSRWLPTFRDSIWRWKRLLPKRWWPPTKLYGLTTQNYTKDIFNPLRWSNLLQGGYLATVPTGLGNAATNEETAHSGKAVRCRHSTVEKWTKAAVRGQKHNDVHQVFVRRPKYHVQPLFKLSFFFSWFHSPWRTLAASHIGSFLSYLDIW